MRLSLAQRFLLGSLVILVTGMTGIGLWVSRQIEGRVIQRTAATTALYVDSLFANSLQDLATGSDVSAEGARRIRWIIEDTPMGQEVVAFRVWDATGRIVFSTDPAQEGQVFPVDDELADAWAGGVRASIGEPEGNVASVEDGEALLEIYSPVRSRDTDEVIAVAEFYYRADDLERELAAAQRRSWLVVGGVAVGIYLLLAAFVQRASNTIERQRSALADQVGRLTELLEQNTELNERVRGAAARTTALNERFLRRFSAELHDGPAQDIGLALLQLDHVQASLSGNGNGQSVVNGRATANGHGGAAGHHGADGHGDGRPGSHPDGDADEGVDAPADPQGPVGAGDPERELELAQASLRRALQDVRDTSAGLLLPHLGGLTVAETVDHAVRAHRRRTGSTVDVRTAELPAQASLATKIAVYRVLQEALANAWRHAGGAGQAVRAVGRDGAVEITVADTGPGFDVAAVNGNGERLGLLGMRERVESLGGVVRIDSRPGEGTRVLVRLPASSADGDGD